MSTSTKNHNPTITNRTNRGFTLVELMVAVAIVGILATLTIPANLSSRQRAEVAEALRMTVSLRDNITYYYTNKLSFPSDNKEAGLPEPEFLIGNKVTKIEIEDGAIHVTLGNKVNKSLQGKIISLRPAVVIDSPTSPISWLCGRELPVSGMEAVGADKTDLMNGLIPSCGS